MLFLNRAPPGTAVAVIATVILLASALVLVWGVLNERLPFRLLGTRYVDTQVFYQRGDVCRFAPERYRANLQVVEARMRRVHGPVAGPEEAADRALERLETLLRNPSTANQ
ncbi:MAG: hypothetical protein ACOC2Y_08195 [Spirochaetota bacterium]